MTQSPYSPPSGTMPGFDGAAVAPSDSANLTFIARALYIGVAGDVKLKTLGGTTLNFVGLQAGSILPVMTLQVFNTSTTATNIVAIS